MATDETSPRDWQWIARLIEKHHKLSIGSIKVGQVEPMRSGLGFLSELFRVQLSDNWNSGKTDLGVPGETGLEGTSRNKTGLAVTEPHKYGHTTSPKIAPVQGMRQTLATSETRPEIPLPKSVVLKLCTADNAFSNMDKYLVDVGHFDQGTWVARIHDQECRFYQFMQENPEHGIPLPRMHGGILNTDLPPSSPTRNEEDRSIVSNGSTGDFRPCIILEDMSDTAGLQYVTDGLTLQQIFNFVDALATFHAFCYNNSHWRNNEHFAAYIWEDLTGARPMSVQVGQQVHRDFPNIFTEKHVQTLETIAADDEIFEQEFHRGVGDIAAWHTLTHGDLWAHNLMFTKNGTIITDKLSAILDWQFVAVGSPTQDLARLLTSSAKTDLRRQYSQSILNRYYEKLWEICEPPFTRDDLDRMWARSLKIASMIMVIDVPALIEFSNTRPEPEEQVLKMIQRCAANLEEVA